jgi:hypothetical protein
MFSFGNQKKRVNLQRYMRRLSDVTAPNNAASMDFLRSDNRSNRVMPTLLCPWENKQADIRRCTVVVTKDFADHGVGLVTGHPFPVKEVVLGFWLDLSDMPHPWFFRGTIRREIPIGGGFWLLGVELIEFMNESWHDQVEPLVPLAKKLLPPSREIPADESAPCVGAGN